MKEMIIFVFCFALGMLTEHLLKQRRVTHLKKALNHTSWNSCDCGAAPQSIKEEKLSGDDST